MIRVTYSDGVVKTFKSRVDHNDIKRSGARFVKVEQVAGRAGWRDITTAFPRETSETH